jgi:hypothetical protein
MFGGLTYMLRGHMCCGVTGERFVARLDVDDAARAIASGRALPFAPAGKSVSGMVTIAGAALRDDDALREWIDRAVAFVSTLPDKT